MLFRNPLPNQTPKPIIRGRTVKVASVSISHWRNFRDVEIQIPNDVSLVCLVGENGSGKSNLLELLAAAATDIGISSGIDIPRGNPVEEEHNFRVTFNFAEDDFISDEELHSVVGPATLTWDKTVALESTSYLLSNGTFNRRLDFLAGGISDGDSSRGTANYVRNRLGQVEDIHYLFLDADRSFPPLEVSPSTFAEELGQDLDLPQRRRDRVFRRSSHKYQEWTQYLLAREGQFAARYAAAVRRARQRGEPDPPFEDPFVSYRESLTAVLPHLQFLGADTEKRTLEFDSAGRSILFSRMSGGEREIAFQIGLIERYGLRRGLLLLDEPELHLNPSLVRAWTEFLRDTVEQGQVWIATHSLEAVEVAGNSSTYVFERSGDTRLVRGATTLRERPVIEVLSRTLGAPAFSLSGRRFIFIEGDEHSAERERFYRLCGSPNVNRFIQAGNCEEVIKKLAAVSGIARESDEQLRVGGVIDSDFRTARGVKAVELRAPIYVLACHEVENLFLQPECLSKLLERAGSDPSSVQEILRRASDKIAGMWILQRSAMISAESNPTLPEPSDIMRSVAYRTPWSDFANRITEKARELAALSKSLSPDVEAKLVESIERSACAYKTLRESADPWKKCLGKQVLGAISKDVGSSDSTTLERQVAFLWQRGEVAPSSELVALRKYVESI
jgi:predicted ATPase